MLSTEGCQAPTTKLFLAVSETYSVLQDQVLSLKMVRQREHITCGITGVY